MPPYQWTYKIGPKSNGPINEGQFIMDICEGNVPPDAWVASETRTQGRWFKLSNIPSFMKLRQDGIDQREEALKGNDV